MKLPICQKTLAPNITKNDSNQNFCNMGKFDILMSTEFVFLKSVSPTVATQTIIYHQLVEKERPNSKC